MDIFKFIPENLFILIASVYVLGVFLKQINTFKDKYITITLMVFSVSFSVLLNIYNVEQKVLYEAAINAILQGVLCWGVAVGINQTTKQLSKEE